MERITTANIEREIEHLLDCAPMNYCNLEKLVLLCKSMKYLSRIHREFTEADARDWMAKMDPPARWTLEQTTAVMKQRGYDHPSHEFCVVMNALVSDYGKTMAKYGADRPEIWADLAHDWLEDHDAEPDKAGRYWRDIVKH